MRPVLPAALFAAAVIAVATGPVAAEAPLLAEDSEQAAFEVWTIGEGMTFPWDMTFLPDGSALISEYSGALRVFRNNALAPAPVETGLNVTARGGLRGVAAHPDFADNAFIYFCYASGEADANHTEIARGRFDGASVRDLDVIFVADNVAQGLAHYGCRLLWDADGALIATFGDRRHNMAESQSLADHNGVVVRLDENGDPFPGNPYADDSNARAEIWAYGIRNAQGAAFHPQTGALWVSEHGPRGGDEINIIERGGNYGWPVVTHGVDYDGSVITDTAIRDDVVSPLFYWYPSIAPSSIAFYTGDAFPDWRGDLFVTTLASRRLLRLELNGDRIIGVEPLLEGLDLRLRSVEMAPDGALYVLTDSGDGRVLKIEPARTE